MLALLVVVLLLAACGRDREAEAGGAIVVAAASDLAAAMPELAAAFERMSGVRVDATLGSSGQIANQVLQGAPIDVFASADRGWIDRLEEAGRLDGGIPPALYAFGRVVMVVPPGRTAPRDLAALRDPVYARIAIANPEHAPYGVAAREALMQAGLWDELQPRLVIGENVRQAHQLAATGSVDVALTAWALVGGAASPEWTLVPETHAPLAQTVAAIADRQNAEDARAFVRFMTSHAARDILVRHNLVVPQQ